MSNTFSGFWAELRRRRVVRVAIGYVALGWVAVEVADVVTPLLLLPDWLPRLVLVLVLIGFPVALFLAWALQSTPQGLRVDPGPGGEGANDDPTRPAAEASTPAAECVAPERRSVVVLPFTNMSDDAANEYFSDGITEEILNLLARQPELRVVSRTTSFSLKHSGSDVRSLAAKLDVETVLEGSVRRAGQRVRITAQLIDAASDAHLWSNQFDREIGDIFAVQAEIARAIVDAIDLDGSMCTVPPATTQNVEAYDFYLRGLQHFHGLTRQSLDLAIGLFRKAIEVDPGFARAYAGLADAHSMIAQWLDRTPEHLEAADRASRKALQLSPELPEAHAARGFALSLNGDFATASLAFERALDLDRQNFDALYFYGRSRFAEGKLEEAAELWRRAHAAQPDEYQALALRVQALRDIDPEAAAAAADEATEVVRKTLSLNPNDLRALSLGAGAFIQAGYRDEGVAMAERALALAPDEIGVLYNAACIFARAGMTSRALDTLERRLEVAGTIYREWVEQDNDLESLRDEPRFQSLLSRMPQAGE